MLVDGQENEASDPRMNEGCVHSSDEEEQESKQDDSGAGESRESSHDCSGSRPLLLDSEEEADEPPHYSALPSQLPSAYPTPNMAQKHCQHSYGSSEEYTQVDVFSSAPFQTSHEDTSDVFANAPFLRPSTAAQQQIDVFAQAPFGKRKEPTGVAMPVQPSSQYHSATEQGVLGNVAQQPFRPQALAKYSRHFEGTIPQQSAHKGGNSGSRQATVGSVPAAHSWTTERSSVDPFVSAPFHLRAPQEKP